MKEISGNTRVFGIIADPIYHVKTPQRLNEHFARTGFDGVCVPFHVQPDGLAAAMAGFRTMQSLGGVIVTMPHKTAVLDLVDQVSPVARKIGAANVIRRNADGSLYAHMLDGEGFVGGLHEAQIPVKGKTAYLAGAGGAANAIGFALVQAGVSMLTIANRTQAKVQDLKDRILSLYPDADIRIGTADPSGHDLVVNGTSLGMKESDALPLDVSRLRPNQYVCEVIMEPKVTPLLRAALNIGCPVQYGAPMLASQIQLMAKMLGAEAEG
ncbi:shikimate dehydrogenase [Comamonas sp. JUb58]|uniref:shikimate dehydrogenase family protein n=1 Tax=Comamonas sp. JUb58 TaxID=2485114 RepID=UPI00105D204D|nr:shikimate dehydrogenase [Comamonas sp. JUb58]TDS78190.1 shikimate dehydrogenase [Comamonas sp. JUb58]